jgi:hypothetical protein
VSAIIEMMAEDRKIAEIAFVNEITRLSGANGTN